MVQEDTKLWGWVLNLVASDGMMKSTKSEHSNRI